MEALVVGRATQKQHAESGLFLNDSNCGSLHHRLGTAGLAVLALGRCLVDRGDADNDIDNLGNGGA